MSLPNSTTRCSDDVRLLAELSHEVRTPLTALLGYVELLLDPPWSEATSAEKSREMLRIVQASGQHVLELVSSVLQWACLDAGGNNHFQPVSPQTLCEEAVAWLMPRIDSSDVRMRCVVHPDAPATVISDPARLRQILLNLLGNALKFTIRGEVTVALSGLTRHGAPWLRIEVCDTGVGMSSAQLARLFKPFAPGDHSASGAGLGLAISQRLCTSLGGFLTAHSEVHEGSTFRLDLPVGAVERKELPATNMTSLAHHGELVLQGQRILLADDSPDTRRLVSLLLRQAGATVTEALHGLEACDLALCGSQPFDLVLLDLHMPICDGLTAARRMRAAGYLAPIVALTAASHPEDCHACLAAGCDGYATKPIDRRTLIQTALRWTKAVTPVEGSSTVTTATTITGNRAHLAQGGAREPAIPTLWDSNCLTDTT